MPDMMPLKRALKVSLPEGKNPRRGLLHTGVPRESSPSEQAAKDVPKSQEGESASKKK